MTTTAQKARMVAHQAVTEGVNLKYVERMRRVLYEAADALAVAEQERDEAQEALREILKLSAGARYAGENALSIARRALAAGDS